MSLFSFSLTMRMMSLDLLAPRFFIILLLNGLPYHVGVWFK
jgi:hypothetical protein